MNYMEREQHQSDGFAKLILKHAGIIRRNIYLIIALTMLGLVAGFIVQKLATDTYIKEVLLKNGNGLHLSVINDLMQPANIQMRSQDGQYNESGRSQPIQNNRPVTNLTIDNKRAAQVVFGGTPQEFNALNLQIVKRVANSNGTKSSVILSLPKDHRLYLKAIKGENERNKVLKKFKISSLTRGSDEILIRFDGISQKEAETVVKIMLDRLRDQFTKLEQDRISAAFAAKILVIDSQIRARELTIKNIYADNSNETTSNELLSRIRNDTELTGLRAEKNKIKSFPVDKVDIEPFIVVPIDLSKKISFVSSITWLLLTAFAGLTFGLMVCYGLYGLKQLKNA